MINLVSLSTLEIGLLVGVAVMAVLFFIVLGIVLSMKKKLGRYQSGEVRVDKVKVIDGVRYTTSDVIADGGEAQVSLVKGDIILKRGEEVVVRKGGVIIPGKYTILAGDDNYTSFNVRLGGYVREFTHNTPVVLDEGEVICPVSHTIILR